MCDYDTKKNNGGDGCKKKEDLSPINVALKVDKHCDGCASTIIKYVRNFNGVETVKAEWENSKLTVFGKVDPVKLRDKLAKKTKKDIVLVSPLPKKTEAKTEHKPKEPPVTTAVLKMNIYCHGCLEEIHHIAKNFKGVHTASIDRENLLTVKGTMDVKALQEELKKKMKRDAEIVPPKKVKDDGCGCCGDCVLWPGYFVEPVHPPQWFSDENPNACNIM